MQCSDYNRWELTNSFVHDETRFPDPRLYNTPDVEENGRPRRNCQAIERDAEFVVTFKIPELRGLSRVVRVVDHQQKTDHDGQAKDAGADVDWKDAWVNLDYGWALLDLGDISPTKLTNTVVHQGSPLAITRIIPSDMSQRYLSKSFSHLVATPCGVVETDFADPVGYTQLARTVQESVKCSWDISFDHNDAFGDIGSWILDSETRELCGILISLDDRGSSRWRYGVALSAAMVLENIRKTMGAIKVTLPGAVDEYGDGDRDYDDQDGEEAEEEDDDSGELRIFWV